MEIWHAVVEGVVEGVTEFLPVSSTGHLMLTSQLLGLSGIEFIKTFEIVIQLGAILAIVVLYPRRLLVDKPTMLRITAGFLPTAVLGLFLYKIIKQYLLGNLPVVICSLLFGGIVIIFLERYWRTHPLVTRERQITDLSLKEAATIGAIQSLAFIPGVSRSATTIFGGMWQGLSRSEAVEFSFFLAVPTMAAATGLDLLKNYKLLAGSDVTLLAVGFIVSFVTALLAIKFLVRYVQTHDFTAFGIYRIIIALLFFGVFFL